MDSPRAHSRLFYAGSKTEVMLGDEILWKPFLRRNKKGKICYIPGISAKHRDFEYEGIKQWAILLEDGDILMMVYVPSKHQPKKNIRFVSRGEPISYPVNKQVY